MAVPKRKTSKARRDSRRAANTVMTAPQLNECPQCHSLVPPHTVCKTCGYYGGKPVVDMDQKEKKNA
ncbi:MAG: 50S ribosomal protein L32 [Eubacteriales bacterium]|nr:50S ribosomal protein L32 [Eubacteriales bacterium]